jgi:predicted 3-demethylubiquinone-9 3-methyltransferase (glyoxalase superfamily)
MMVDQAPLAEGQEMTISPKITPCLWFDSQAAEAAELYVSLFPSSRIVSTTYYGEGAPMPAGSVLTVTFELEGHQFVALNGGPAFSFDEAISFQIHCEDQAETDHYWDALVDGGEEGQCGWLKDRYGLSWQVVPVGLPELLSDPDPDRARRAMDAMLKMQRLDIAAIKKAADGGA